MKKLIKQITLLVTTIILFAANANAQTKEVTIQTSAQCGECKEKIEKALMEKNGVKFAELNSQTKRILVAYNEKKISPEEIRKTISLTGYDADDVPADSAAVLRLKPCCTKDGHIHH